MAKKIRLPLTLVEGTVRTRLISSTLRVMVWSEILRFPITTLGAYRHETFVETRFP